MGLDINGARCMVAAQARGVRFDSVLTLGRQFLNVYPTRMVQLLAKYNRPTDSFVAAGEECSFAEPFFRCLGATTVDSLDNSAFEGATLIHDLNLPVPEALKQKYAVVYDGGTIEHVFNFPAVMKNLMEMTRVDGRVFIHTCANNLLGHGLYQFSPELFFRVFSAANGFEVERMILHRVGPYGRWYEVSDPDQIRERVELITFTPMHLLIQARRVAAVPIFATPPQQSDYLVMWQQGEERAGEFKSIAGAPKAPWLSRYLPALARLIHVARTGVAFYRRQSLSNRRFFKPVPKP